MCNKSRKGVFNPLRPTKKGVFCIFNPYRFDATAFTFYYDIASANYWIENDYNVLIDFKKNKDLERGYSRKLAMETYYATKRHIIVDLYNQMGRLSKYYMNDLLKLGASSKNIFLESVLGYSLNEVESRRKPYYKFRLDMANQMIDDSGCKWPW